MIPEDKKIILFDGVCNLCNTTIIFIINRDKEDTFRFAALQSSFGKKLVKAMDIDVSVLDSILLVESTSTYYYKSDAALHIAKHLSGGYSFLNFLLIIPQFIRDRVYDFIAKNRYVWLGKKNSCMIPTPEFKALFIDHL